MEVQVERRSGCLVLRVIGDLRLWNCAEAEEELLATIRSSLEEPPPRVVLNLQAVNHLDTRGIWGLVPVLVGCSKKKIGLRVIFPPGVPGEALRRVRIFEPWPEFSDENAAIEAAGA